MSKIQIIEREGTFANRFAEAVRRHQSLNELTHSRITKNAVIRRARIPKHLVYKVQKNMGEQFKMRPKLYVYAPRRGTSFGERKYERGRSGEFLGLSMLVRRAKPDRNGMIQHKPIDSYILIPKAYAGNKKMRDIVIEHEMVEQLAGQHGIPFPQSHTIAERYDAKNIKRLKLKSRKELIKQLIDIYNDRREWKPILKRRANG